ncbi:MAG: hypothetical protein JNK82_38455 [Myxococcaceae bacterium]|nr:hypothetical protein [Myxococcaceae bacterium]
MQPLPLFAVAALALMPACASCYNTCAEPTEAELAPLPSRLSETGLFGDAGVIVYAPAFELWADGAEKHRALLLPPGAQIDTRNPDDWQFPEGTRVWKTFVRDGVRVETRLLLKTGDSWAAAAYRWDGDDAVLFPEGGRDVNGTPHDVPAAATCTACHGGRASFVLGFSALQLANVAPGGFTLDEAVSRGLLSQPPASTAALRIPGDAKQRAALGYLHANCAHCHNADRPEREGPRCFAPRPGLDLLLRAGELGDAQQTATYRTLVPRGASAAHSRMEARQMPPLATEEVDTAGVALIRAWAESP